jgi:hypothetical protein
MVHPTLLLRERKTMWAVVAALLVALVLLFHGGIYDLTVVQDLNRPLEPHRVFRLNRVTGTIETCTSATGTWNCFPIPSPKGAKDDGTRWKGADT